MNLILKCILGAALVYAMLLALLFIFQRSQMYFPDRRIYTQAQVGVQGFTEITVTTKDGLALKAWYSAAQDGKPTLVLFHGNAGSYRNRAPGFMPLVRAGYGVLLAEYRGFGGNPGKPSEKGLYRDADAYLRYLQTDLKIPAGKIALYGESLGTGVAVEMGLRHPDLGGLVLESPYTSMVELAALHYPHVPFLRYLVRDKYDTSAKIADLKVPVLVLIGGRDTLVPPQMGQALFEKLTGKKDLKVYPDADHLSIRDHGAMDALQDFLQSL